MKLEKKSLLDLRSFFSNAQTNKKDDLIEKIKAQILKTILHIRKYLNKQ